MTTQKSAMRQGSSWAPTGALSRQSGADLRGGGHCRLDAPYPSGGTAVPNLPGGPTGTTDSSPPPSLASGDSVVLSLLAQPGGEITRLGFLRLAAALPEEALSPIITISALPDSADSHVLRFITPAFSPASASTVSSVGAALCPGQAAAMVSRVARRTCGRPFPTFDAAVWASGMTRTRCCSRAGEDCHRESLSHRGRGPDGGLKTDYNWNDLRGGRQNPDGLCERDGLLQSGRIGWNGDLALSGFDLQVFYSRYLDLTETVMA